MPLLGDFSLKPDLVWEAFQFFFRSICRRVLQNVIHDGLRAIYRLGDLLYRQKFIVRHQNPPLFDISELVFFRHIERLCDGQLWFYMALHVRGECTIAFWQRQNWFIVLLCPSRCTVLIITVGR